MRSAVLKKKKSPCEGLTLAQMKEQLLATGKVTDRGLAKARTALEADSEWQAFIANQPQPAGR